MHLLDVLYIRCRLNEEIEDFYLYMTPLPEERVMRQKVIERVTGLVTELWPSAKVLTSTCLAEVCSKACVSPFAVPNYLPPVLPVGHEVSGLLHTSFGNHWPSLTTLSTPPYCAVTG